jgi:c-di-GMP-binding flagellar brake protein YcgR
VLTPVAGAGSSPATVHRFLCATAMDSDHQERRKHRRLKIAVPVELRPEGSTVSGRAATADLSVGGCYVEMTFTLANGTSLEIKLKINGTILASASVVTCDPNFGNGIRFDRMEPEDIEELTKFLEAAKTNAG